MKTNYTIQEIENMSDKKRLKLYNKIFKKIDRLTEGKATTTKRFTLQQIKNSTPYERAGRLIASHRELKDLTN